MANTKKNIDAFQKAMLSNTKIIGNDSRNRQSSSGSDNSKHKTKQNETSLIPQDLLKKCEVLAQELNIRPNEVIELALNHFIELKGFWKG